MKTEIERVLDMVKDGTLTPAQASEMIAALTGGASEANVGGSAAPNVTTPGDASANDTVERAEAADEPTHPQDASANRAHDDANEVRSQDDVRSRGDDDTRGRRSFRDAHDRFGRSDDRDWRSERRHRRHRHRGRAYGYGFDRVFDDLGNDIERAMGAGARTLRWALKSGLQLKGNEWAGDSNNAVFSRADAPSGTDFVCEDNDLAVSNLRDLRLNRSTFSHNELNASSVQDVELSESHMTGLKLRGSSIKGALVEKGQVSDGEFNGAGLVNLTVNEGRLIACRLNGAQVRDLGISKSALEDSRFNGSKIKTIVVRADSLVKGLSTNGVLGRNWLFENAVVSDSQFSGVRVDGLVLKRSGLERVVIKTTDWSERLEANSLGLVRDLELQSVILKDCRFEDCRFDGTRFEGFDASDLTFTDVDFSGMVIKSADDLIRLGARSVA
jgi:uncharacterized protein YjbI with pentapeptide repeats